MENNELTNNEVMETEEIANVRCEEKDYNLLIAGIGIGVVAGIAAYNYVIKPVASKVKEFIAKKKAESEEKQGYIVLEQSEAKVS